MAQHAEHAHHVRRQSGLLHHHEPELGIALLERGSTTERLCHVPLNVMFTCQLVMLFWLSATPIVDISAADEV